MLVDSVTLLAALAVILAGFVRGFSGFGAGMILVPALSLLYNPITAVVTVVLLELIPAVQLLPGALRHCHWRSVIPMSLLACVAVPVGSLLLINIDAETMRLAIAMLVLAGVVIIAAGWRYTGTDRYGHASMLTGLSSGLISGATSLGGLPVVLFYLSGSHSARVSRASMIVFLVVTAVVAVLTYVSHGIVTSTLVGFAAWQAPLFIVSIYAGKRMFGSISESVFRNAILTMLGGIGVIMLFSKI